MQKVQVTQFQTSEQRIKEAQTRKNAPQIFIETYGCQMNVADSETVASVMLQNGYAITNKQENADIVFINTCSIRDNAEQKIRNRLVQYKGQKKKNPALIVGILGCMAERLKEKLVQEEKIVDIVAGPDAYRSLPALVEQATEGNSAINVLLSREETYAEISPVRMDKNKVSAFISITRGCDNMCSFCVVPFTRGRERSRNPETILREITEVVAEGYKEVTLLGQNVDKYNWNNGEVKFAQLLKMSAEVNPKLRIRFSTSYPQDFTDEVLYIMAAHKNICKYIHLPVQSGSTRMLEIMKRGYTREWYLNRIAAIRRILPNCGISTDIIAGHCSETEEDHQQTLSLIKEVGYDSAYMFKYSERPNTYAQRQLSDDVPEEVKARRLTEIITEQHKMALKSNKKDIGKTFEVLVEGHSKKSEEKFYGRTDQNKVIVFPKGKIDTHSFVNVKVTGCTSATLLGEIVE